MSYAVSAGPGHPVELGYSLLANTINVYCISQKRRRRYDCVDAQVDHGIRFFAHGIKGFFHVAQQLLCRKRFNTDAGNRNENYLK